MNLTQEQYDALKKRNAEASANNDYGKMIMVGSEESLAMRRFEQDKCQHGNITTSGGVDTCGICGKQI